MSKDTEKATQVKDQVARETRDVELQAQEVRRMQEDAHNDLEAAMPAMERAIAALNSLSKGEITEVKSFAQPPALVQVVMEAVCLLLQQPTSWDSARRVLGQPDFMKQLLNYDKDNIDDKTLSALKRFTLNPEFVPENVENVSKAAKGLCMWVRAVDTYAGVAKEVEPKRKRLKEADELLQVAQSSLAEKQAQLESVVEKVRQLEEQLAQAQSDQKQLQDEADLCEARVARAAKLTSALGAEQVEWMRAIRALDEKLVKSVGDVMLSSACVTYFGPFNAQYRQRFVRQAHAACIKYSLDVSDSFSLRDILASDVDIRHWSICGLPSDAQSIDSGVIVMNARRWPLLIDPQAQANKWIRGMLEPMGLRVLRPNDTNFVRSVEACVRNGTSLLLEETGETLHSALRPILAKQVFRQDGRLLIKIGDAEVDYDRNFRLFMTTTLRNPHYLPDVSIQTTVIDFTVTVQALEEQLLGTLVRKERPELENNKDKLVISMAGDKKQLQDLQDKVLQKLKQSQGLILDNEPLVTALQQSKQTSTMISRRFEEAMHTDADISALREEYRGVAERAAVLYFVIDSLAGVNPMYQYSLSFFKATYGHCIDMSDQRVATPAEEPTQGDDSAVSNSAVADSHAAGRDAGGSGQPSGGRAAPTSAVLSDRLATLLQAVTNHTFQIVCRGLFEADKALFSILVCIAIERAAGHVEEDEWNFFLRGARMAAGDASSSDTPNAAGISDKTWALCLALEQIFDHPFAGLTAAITARPSAWAKWMAAAAPHKTPIPAPFTKLDGTFHAVMLVRVLREEKTALALSAYVVCKMGATFCDFPVVQLRHVFPDTSCATPIVFLLSSGCDPTAMLFKFAQDVRKAEGMMSVSLGQGQGPLAQKLVDKAAKKGEWVCLMNCHLAASWMPELEKIVSAMAGGSPQAAHADFRLWLTSKPSAAFPVAVLQASQKITDEAPKGLRANMLGSLQLTVTEEGWNQSSKPLVWRKLLASLTLFHAVVQERRKFGPLGWNVKYEFSITDFACAKDMLHLFVEKFDTVPWDALIYVTGQIVYGGRVTDELDRRCLMSILQQYYRSDVLAVDQLALSASGVYYVPQPGSFEDMLAYVMGLPQDDDAEAFSMHSNANIALQRQVCRTPCACPLWQSRVMRDYQASGSRHTARFTRRVLQESMRLIETIVSIQPRAAPLSLSAARRGDHRGGDRQVQRRWRHTNARAIHNARTRARLLALHAFPPRTRTRAPAPAQKTVRATRQAKGAGTAHGPQAGDLRASEQVDVTAADGRRLLFTRGGCLCPCGGAASEASCCHTDDGLGAFIAHPHGRPLLVSDANSYCGRSSITDSYRGRADASALPPRDLLLAPPNRALAPPHCAFARGYGGGQRGRARAAAGFSRHGKETGGAAIQRVARGVSCELGAAAARPAGARRHVGGARRHHVGNAQQPGSRLATPSPDVHSSPDEYGRYSF